MEDLEPFYPDRMAGRILGMGDVLSFVEKATEVVSSFSVKLQSKLCFPLPLSLSIEAFFICLYRCVKKMQKICRRR